MNKNEKVDTPGWDLMYADVTEYALALLGADGDVLPDDIADCPEGCEAETGLKHLLWHLAVRRRTAWYEGRLAERRYISRQDDADAAGLGHIVSEPTNPYGVPE